MEDIVLRESGATVVELQDKAGEGVPNTKVVLIADPAEGSWLHPLGFRQQAVTSALGSARFTRISPGRIIARVKTSNGSAE